ncbi:MAG: hypothetical protein AABW64_04055 [Nanoarchaeota archaeon]
MKIMKVIDKKVGDVTYYKYRINLPKEVVEKSGFLDKEIKASFKNKEIVIEENN